MKKNKRIFLVEIDSLCVGVLPDAVEYGDDQRHVGADLAREKCVFSICYYIL